MYINYNLDNYCIHLKYIKFNNNYIIIRLNITIKYGYQLFILIMHHTLIILR